MQSSGMPELAEVEYFRAIWDAGVRQRVEKVKLHAGKRIFRGSDSRLLQRALTGATFLGSETRGKQIALRFSGDAWLGIHLGMSGDMRVEPPDFKPEKHDHLTLFQKKRALVLKDPRMFGRVRFHVGKDLPDWWSSPAPAITSRQFSLKWVREALQRRRGPIKGALLSQNIFPGVGNWMADEILWQAGVSPTRVASGLNEDELHALWKATRSITKTALKTIGVDWGDPPKNWLIHVRWKKTGKCPRDGSKLCRETIAGRTTAWCAQCQE